jgi:integrase
VSRKGYSIFQRRGRGIWYVAWRDGTRKRRVEKGSLAKNIAHEIGRAKAQEADRIRGGVINADEARATAAAREPLSLHVDTWKLALKHKGNTSHHIEQQAMRVRKLTEGLESRADIHADRISAAVAAVAEVSSPNNARHYLGALRTFVKWCMKTNRLMFDPIAAVEMPRVAGETFRRTALADAQVFAIVHAARTRPCKCRVPGTDRAMYYLVLAYTGLRKSEALSLSPESFDWRKGTVTVEAGYSKHRRRDTQELPKHVAKILRPFIELVPAGRRVFRFPRHMNWHRVFEMDCAAAKVKPRVGEVLGLHSFRRWYITTVDRAAGLAVAQKLARHSTPALTAKYRDVSDEDRAKGISGLPAPKVGRSAAARA